jgi:DNA-binding SARP family transcriptional activator
VLRARLLGALEVELNGAVIDSPASQRPWAVFAYIALAGRPVARAELATRFWPDVLDQSSRASLRSVLWTLRRKLGDELVVDGERVGLSDGEGVWIDVREFQRAAEEAPGEALALCRGELLEGIEDDWALAARARHGEHVIELLENLAQACERRGNVREAIELSRRQVERDPFDEAAHRRLMARLDAAGDRAGALLAYRALSQRVRRELGVPVSALTREVAEQLRSHPPTPATTPTPAGVAAPAARGPVSPSSPASAPGMLPLVGRHREIIELEETWKLVSAGSGAAAIIRGEAGIGKTRLSTELRSRVSRTGGLTAACAALDLGGTAPLSLWAELIRELLPSLPAPPADAAWPQELAALTSELPAHFVRAGEPSNPVAPDLQRTRLYEAVVALLGWAAESAPLLVILEDVHSADAASLELAGYAARRLAGLRMMMLITRRELPHSAEADRFEHALRSRGLLARELDLDPLLADQVSDLARATANLDDADLRRVVERAEGNPLLAVETARAIGRGRGEIAPSLRGSVRATLAPLAGDVRRLVETAAVAARRLEALELGQLQLESPGEVAAQSLETGLLLSDQGRIGFVHALLRDAVYAEIAEPRRRSLHQQWAQALLSSERAGASSRAAEIARHLRLSGDDTDAVPELARAAAGARAVAALGPAVAFLAEALSIAPARADLWLELGELEAWRGRRDQAEDAFGRARAHLGDGSTLSLAQAWLRRARAFHGPICDPRAVLESAANALAILESIETRAPNERSEALAALAWAEAVAGSVEEAERLLDELSAEATDGDDLRTYDVGHARALTLMRRGRFAESYGPQIAAGEAVARAGRPDLTYGCWANAASAAAAAAEHERALEFLDRGQAAIEGHGLRSLEVHLLAARCFVLSGCGRLAQARAVAEAEQGLAEQLGHPDLLAMAWHDRGLVALQQGEHELAATLLADSLEHEAPISRPLTRLALAEALARGGHPERAQREVRATVLEPVRPSDFPESLIPRLAHVQALIALAQHQPDEAGRRIEESIAGWKRVVARTKRAETITTVLADLGRPVVGLVEPESGLARATAELQRIQSMNRDEAPNAVIP